MKTKTIKHGYCQPPHVEKKGSVFSRLRSMITFNRQLPAPILGGVRINVLEQRLLEERLIELEAERKRAAGLAYANMLPPR
jgi:hypothetical protein